MRSCNRLFFPSPRVPLDFLVAKPQPTLCCHPIVCFQAHVHIYSIYSVCTTSQHKPLRKIISNIPTSGVGAALNRRGGPGKKYEKYPTTQRQNASQCNIIARGFRVSATSRVYMIKISGSPARRLGGYWRLVWGGIGLVRCATAVTNLNQSFALESDGFFANL